MAHLYENRMLAESEEFIQGRAIAFLEEGDRALKGRNITTIEAYNIMKAAIRARVDEINTYFANYAVTEDTNDDFERFYRFYNPDFQRTLPRYSWAESFITKCDILVDAAFGRLAAAQGFHAPAHAPAHARAHAPAPAPAHAPARAHRLNAAAHAPAHAAAPVAPHNIYRHRQPETTNMDLRGGRTRRKRKHKKNTKRR